jgi:PhoH-like ATPase
MNHAKHYIVDTNVLLEDPNALFKLRNGNENSIYLPYHVLLELNKLKKDQRLGHTVTEVVQNLSSYPGDFKILKAKTIARSFSNLVDSHILKEIRESGLDQPILITNDKIMQLQAALYGIKSESYQDSVPFKFEDEYYTGFVKCRDDVVPNAFMFNEQGKLIFFAPEGERIIDYQHNIWSVRPRNIYQNMAVELMIHPDIDIVSIQSEAGYGKSFLALASALYLTLEKKAYNKIYMVKPMIEIGQKLGYLPGKIEEKMAPYTRYITDLILKLHSQRHAGRIFSNSNENPPRYDLKRFELLPLAYIRGLNIEQSVVIIDEMQNLSRSECRAILSRMGEGVKCICLGDTSQVDNPYLSRENNGLKWIVNKFKGSKIYGHLVLKGDKSRGPITDLVIKSGL